MHSLCEFKLSELSLKMQNTNGENFHVLNTIMSLNAIMSYNLTLSRIYVHFSVRIKFIGIFSKCQIKKNANILKCARTTNYIQFLYLNSIIYNYLSFLYLNSIIYTTSILDINAQEIKKQNSVTFPQRNLGKSRKSSHRTRQRNNFASGYNAPD